MEIFKRLVRSITGPKFNYYYTISYTNKSPCRKISVGNYECRVTAYFDRRIRISVKTHTLLYDSVNSWYLLSDKDTAVPDPQDYIITIYNFLFELMRWGSHFKYQPHDFRTPHPPCMDDPDLPFPVDYREDLFLHEYSWDRPDEIRYAADLFKSKPWKRKW